MIALPPYALAPVTFRFRALVSLAERLPIGGEREVVLATFVAARLLWDWTEDSGLGTAGTVARAQGARQWLQSLSLPAAVRSAFQQVTDAVAADDRAAALSAWERAIGLTSRAIEAAAKGDFKMLTARLRGEPPVAEGAEAIPAGAPIHA